MKKLAFLVLLFTTSAWSQISYKTVTATITDPLGHPYANAAYVISLLDKFSYPITSATAPDGALFSAKTITGTTDAAGHFSVKLAPNASLSKPSETQWKITVSVPGDFWILSYQPAWDVNYKFVVSADADLSDQLSALATPVWFINLKTGQSTFAGSGSAPSCSGLAVAAGGTWGACLSTNTYYLASNPNHYISNIDNSMIINALGNPSLIAGTNCTITGSWPNQTINCTGNGGISGTINYIPQFTGPTSIGNSPCYIDSALGFVCGDTSGVSFLELDAETGGGMIRVFAPNYLTTIDDFIWPAQGTGALCNPGDGNLTWGGCGLTDAIFGAGLTGTYDGKTLYVAMDKTSLTINHQVMELGGDYTLDVGSTQVQSDWTEADSAQVDYIKNKPTAASATSMLISGGGVVWTGGMNFTVSAAEYQIAGTPYSSPLANVTLATADPSNSRLDAFIVDSTGAASVITGTPSPTPVTPSIDPTSQLFLANVLVAAGASTPTITNENIYLENTEWTSAVTAHFNAASTVNPYQGTKDIEATAAVAGNNVTLTKPSGTENLTTWNTLSFYIRNKAAWASTKSLSIVWMNGATTVGTAIALKNGVYGFDQNNATTYQQIVIPLTAFQAGTTLANAVKFQVAGSGTAIGFYIDNVVIQTSGSGSGSGGGLYQIQSDWLQSNNALPDYIRNKPSIPTSSSVSVNGVGVTSPNFNDLTPAVDPGYTNVTFQHATGANISAEVPSAFNPTTTAYIFVCDSRCMVASTRTISATGVSCDGTNCVFSTSGTFPATSLLPSAVPAVGQWVQMASNSPAFSPACMQWGLGKITAVSAGVSFTIPEASLGVNSTCSGVTSGTAGLIQDGAGFYPTQASTRAYFSGHGTVYNLGVPAQTTATAISTWTAAVHPHTFAVTGQPCYVFLQVGSQDVLNGTATSTIETNLTTLVASATTDGCTPIVTTPIPGHTNFHEWLHAAQVVNDWVEAQPWKFITFGKTLPDPDNADYFGTPASIDNHLNDAGASILADKLNLAMSAKGGARDAASAVMYANTWIDLTGGKHFHFYDGGLWTSGGIQPGASMDFVCSEAGATPICGWQYGVDLNPFLLFRAPVSGAGRDVILNDNNQIGWNNTDGGAGHTDPATATKDTCASRPIPGTVAFGDCSAVGNNGGHVAATVATVVDTSTPVTVSTVQTSEFHFNENGTAAAAITYNLPTAVAGKQFCFSNAYNGSAADTGVLNIQTSASGQYIIFIDGTLSASGGYVSSTGVAGDAGCVVGVDATHWAFYAQRGTWGKH